MGEAASLRSTPTESTVSERENMAAVPVLMGGGYEEQAV